ncbi:MAG: helix-turn-helix transcriptional regulator [Eubacteriales bacterium]|nr:helix-turn-helix transcriptional regulator [Eubacteriales bacterium]
MRSEYTERFRNLGLQIARYRKQKGLTQMDLAKKAGISRTHISNIEAAGIEKGISLELLFHIADILEVPVEKLLRD